jgi:hypothetical protein
MFDEAQELQQRAKNNLRSDQPAAAFELSQQARRMAMRAVKIFTSQANESNVEQALRLTDALLDQAQEMAADRNADQLSKRIDRAGQLQSDAKQQFDNGGLEQALKTTLRARSILKDALSSIKSEISREDVEPALRGTDKLLDRVKEIVKDANDPVATDLFARARAKQDKAWQDLGERRFRSALTSTRLARKLANQAFEQIANESL